MNHTSIKKISLTLLLAATACGTLFAQNLRVAPGTRSIVPYRQTDSSDAVPFYTNLYLDACNGCTYDPFAGGYYVWGVNNCVVPGQVQWIAMPFYASHSGNASRLTASITLDVFNGCATTNAFNLGIWSDNCQSGTSAGPLSLLGEGKSAAPASPCQLSTARLRTPVALTAGTKYWLVARTVGQTQATFDGVWYASNVAQIGYSLDGSTFGQFSSFSPGGSIQ